MNNAYKQIKELMDRSEDLTQSLYGRCFVKILNTLQDMYVVVNCGKQDLCA